MGWNTGILFGEVWSSDGPTENAIVTIDWLKGDLTMPSIKVQMTETENENVWVSTQTNSDGKYVLPFFWDPLGFASATSNTYLTMRTYVVSGSFSSQGKRVKAHLSLDLRKLFGAVFPNFDNLTEDFLECAKDFHLAYRLVKPFPPTHKIMLSTEVWGVLARANFFLYVD